MVSRPGARWPGFAAPFPQTALRTGRATLTASGSPQDSCRWFDGLGRPGRRDRGSSPAVAGDRHRGDGEKFDLVDDDRPPAVRAFEPSSQGCPGHAVTVHHHRDDAPPRECVETVEGVFGHRVPEIVYPSAL